MSAAVLYVMTAAAVFGIGMYGLLVASHILRQLLSLNLMSGGIFLMLITLGGGAEGPPDPVPQAMVLTGIVVAISATAFALALLTHMNEVTGQASLETDGDEDEDEEDDGH